MKFAGQVNRDTFGKYYAHPLSEVDGPANYLGIASRNGHIQNRRGMGMYQNPHLWHTLPAKAEFEFQDREDIRALDETMMSLGFQLLSVEGREEKQKVQLKQHQVYNERQRLYKEELKRIQLSQPHKPTSTTEHQGSIWEQTLFHYRRRVMPQRDLLANILPQKISLRHHDGRRALEALEYLCKEINPIAYREGLRPWNKRCLCGKAIDEYVVR